HLAAFAQELFDLTLDSSRKVRAEALPVARRLGPAVLDIAKRAAVEQKPEQRALALRFIWELGDDARGFVRERAEQDPAESVRKAVQSLQSGTDVAAGSPPMPAVAEGAVALDAPLSPDSRQA